jgi:predicted phosphodiesterase
MHRELVNAYLDRMGDRDFSNRTLARQIVRENPGRYPDQSLKDIEAVRASIRIARGAHGKKDRPLKVDKFVREEMRPSEYMRSFMQKGDRTAKDPWHLPDNIRKPLVLSDLHIPYHHIPSIDASLNYGFKEGVDAIYINGDLIDFAKISRWSKDPALKSVQVEVDQVLDFLEGLTGLGLPVYFKLGNHEDRWNRYLIDQAPELYDLDTLQINNLLSLDEMGVKLVDSKQRAKFGDHLNVIHGHEFGQSIFSPVNPARGLFLRAKTNVIAGHNHQTSSHHESNLNGSPTGCFSTGCLCDLEPDYRPFGFTKWNHGAAIVEIEDGDFSVDNFAIIDGKIRS